MTSVRALFFIYLAFIVAVIAYAIVLGALGQ